jgi:hypothetical protein
MKWYYRWQLKKIRRKISVLKQLSSYTLVEDYTANSRLRILSRLEQHLEQQLSQLSSASIQH